MALGEMKNIRATIGLVLIYLLSINLNMSLAQSLTKKLNYKIKFNGIHSASAQTEISSPFMGNTNVIRITWNMKSKSIFRMLFHVNNSYTSILDVLSKKVLETQKQIDQKNIKHLFNIAYNWNKNKAEANNGVIWAVPPQTLDIFSLIYLLQITDLPVGTGCHFTIDFESWLFDVSGKVIEPLSDKQKGQRLIVLNFNAIDPLKPRTWKTDLLTNRLGKPGTVLSVSYTPQPDSVPLLIKFTKDNSTVEMQLDN
jgi:hypothetical protein